MFRKTAWEAGNTSLNVEDENVGFGIRLSKVYDVGQVIYPFHALMSSSDEWN